MLAINRVAKIVAFVVIPPLVVFFSNNVIVISFTARQRFLQDGIRSRIQQRDPWSRGPGFEQNFGIFYGCCPGENVSIAMEALDDMHVLAVEVAADLVKPGAADESI